MAYDPILAARIREVVARNQNIVEKKLFGGVGFLLQGNLLVAAWKDSLVVRLGPVGYDEALLEPHVDEFDVTGKPMKGWVMVAPEGVDEDAELVAWIARAMQFVETLPAK